ncbi:hypothetical protein ACFL9T_00785 [Thermodesulfobacteriota bacterium]
MSPTELPLTETLWGEDPFNFIKYEEFEILGVDPSDIPPGTFAAHKHPSQLPSRYGGNAYGFGLFEVYGRLKPTDIQLLQATAIERPEDIKKYYKKINLLYKKIGLLIRFSRLGKPYYLIPVHLVSSSLAHIKNKADEISRVIAFHRKKYLKESQKIGLLTHADDLLINHLSIRFKEHHFVIIDSLEKLHHLPDTFDLVILSRDPYETLLMERFHSGTKELISKRQLETYAIYMLGKVYQLLKPNGELFVIANHHTLKTNRTAEISFNTVEEEKNFILFSHIFRTKKRYRKSGKSYVVNVYDFQKYLGGRYVEPEVINQLTGERNLESLAVGECNNLPYLNYSLDDKFSYDQVKTWQKILTIFFNQILSKSLVPASLKSDWERRFNIKDYDPDYMLVYLGQKKHSKVTLEELKKDVMESRLGGCLLPLLADYRNSMSYLLRTLEVLQKIKTEGQAELPEIYMERLRQPFENKKRRYSGLNDVIKLMAKMTRLERLKSYLNPDQIEGPQTKVLSKIELFPLFGFSYGELREIFLIIVGHTAMGRILSGKMNEKALKPVSDLARTYEPMQAVNFLSYCRLMSMAEKVASKMSEMNQEELAELFDLHGSMVRIVTSRDMDWDSLLDEKINAMGGVHNKIVRKILKMMNHFQFLDNWSELNHIGQMEKESLADYDERKLASIENVNRLIKIIEEFEKMFQRNDPLHLPIFYRKFLNMEFHGTGHLFERMDSELVFILLWIAVHVVRGEIVNFNPIMREAAPSSSQFELGKVESELRAINRKHLDSKTLNQFSDQLYQHGSAFLVGTGFHFSVNSATQALDIAFIDMDLNIKKLDDLARNFSGHKISEIPKEDLGELERLFANLEGFYQSHQRLIRHGHSKAKLPVRQNRWFKKAEELREYLILNFTKIIFRPENIYTDINLLYRYAPIFMKFILPEFMALQDAQLPGQVHLKVALIDHILASTQKIEALIKKDKESFQDVDILHKLAQREFGPMAAGIVGLNEAQIEILEEIVGNLSKNQPLFDALVKSFIFRDMGLIPALKEKYKGRFNRADHAKAGAQFLEAEGIPARYQIDAEAQDYLINLVKYHDLLHHMFRGEFSFYALEEVTAFKDKAFLDACFVSSFMMFSAMSEDLILEDSATRLFLSRDLSIKIIEGETRLKDYLNGIYAQRGRLYLALEAYRRNGLPQGMTPTEYLESFPWEESEREQHIHSGKLVYAIERIFRLRGIKYVGFLDLAYLMTKMPMSFIYKKKQYSSIGYATFEKELFEALRIYNRLQKLPELARHFMLSLLDADDIRIFGFEKVSAYLNYENQIKLLLIALMGTNKFKKNDEPVNLDFFSMAEKIEIRYEAVNDSMSQIQVEKIWESPQQLNHFFKSKTGLALSKDEEHKVLSIDFLDKMNISKKLAYIRSITDIDQLKNYYHHGLGSLRKSPFYTDDYEADLEKTYEGRLREITDLMLEQANRQMALIKNIREINNIYLDLMERSLDIGFTEDQKHRLLDLYELRKDSLKREKIEEIDGVLKNIQDENELKDYWDRIKWYLLNNRLYLGKEFEKHIAKKFDESQLRFTGNQV